VGAIFATSLAVASGAACNGKGVSVAVEPTPASTASLSQPAARAGGDDDLTYDPVAVRIIAIDIDTVLATTCGLEQSKVFFKFDSAALRPSAKERLEKIATCSKTGPIRGQALLVIGRTDPVGTDAYNDLLGMSRADSVVKYLAELGVDQTLMATESKGEDAAEADYPGGWPYDRRVTVRLRPAPATGSLGQ